jgi:hydrogenase maturation protease
MKTLLLGMGNPFLCDDSVGVRLAVDLARELRGIPDLDVMEECSVGGLNLLDVLRGYDRAVVLDSIQTEGGVPGTWYRFGFEELEDTIHLTNIHDVNFATAILLGRRLGMHLPSETHIFAVEVLENKTFSERMTPDLEQAYPRIARGIFEQVCTLLGVPRVIAFGVVAASSRSA